MTPETPIPSDAELVERLRRRDKRALEDLLFVHGAKLHGVARQFMRDEHDAQEVMQDALVNIWRKIDSFEGRSAFPSWLYRVTANAALMALRKKRRRAPEFSGSAPDAVADEPVMQLADPAELPDQTVMREELGRHIRSAVDCLHEPYRTVVLLRDVEEFALEEIAEMTGASVPAVNFRLIRGRLALRKHLLPYLKAEAHAGT